LLFLVPAALPIEPGLHGSSQHKDVPSFGNKHHLQHLQLGTAMKGSSVQNTSAAAIMQLLS
jgi:hypothetical protein